MEKYEYRSVQDMADELFNDLHYNDFPLAGVQYYRANATYKLWIGIRRFVRHDDSRPAARVEHPLGSLLPSWCGVGRKDVSWAVKKLPFGENVQYLASLDSPEFCFTDLPIEMLGSGQFDGVSYMNDAEVLMPHPSTLRRADDGCWIMG